MGKEVLVTVCGIQMADGETSEPIEVVSAGERFEKNGKIYIIYDEVVQEDTGTASGEIVKNTIRIDGQQLDLIKRGEGGTHLVFNEGESNQTYYRTPYGNMEVTLHTSQLKMNVDEELIEVIAKYHLEINHAQIAECVVSIKVKG